MKAMPLLLQRTITMKIPDDFDTVLAINSLALRQIAMDMIYYDKYRTGLSGGFMIIDKCRN